MKKTLYNSIVAVAAMALMAACGGNQNKTPEATDTTTAEGISVCSEADWVTVYGITDREGEQSVDLFRGQDDALLESLLAEGQTGFRSAFNVFVAVGEEHTVLFDAGIGTQGGGTMVEKLRSLGIEPEALKDICLTHLHFDHIGGLLTDGQAVFPNATLHLSQREYDAYAGDERWQQVLAAYDGRIETFGDSAMLFDGLVQTIPAYGHTPGHTVYTVGTCLIAGDLLHAQDLQLQHPDFCARYDADPAQAVAMRRHYYGYARENGLYLCGAHCYDTFIDLSY